MWFYYTQRNESDVYLDKYKLWLSTEKDTPLPTDKSQISNTFRFDEASIKQMISQYQFLELQFSISLHFTNNLSQVLDLLSLILCSLHILILFHFHSGFFANLLLFAVSATRVLGIIIIMVSKALNPFIPFICNIII